MECAARLTKKSETHYVCRNLHHFYNNPRAAATVVLINVHGRVLYAKRAYEPAKGKYDFPGGFLNYGENALMAAKRAMYLETGAGLIDVKLIDSSLANEYQGMSACNFVFACTRWEGELVAGEDAEELEWKSLDFMRDERFAWEYPGLYERLLPLTRNLKAKGFDIAKPVETNKAKAHKAPRKLLQ